MTDFVSLSRERLAGYRARSLELNGWMPAAVLLLLYPKAGSDHILFTVRTNRVEHHKGQISFPGGAVHAADADLATTALRETYEEVGVEPEAIEMLGRLDDTVTISNFRVTPFVGVLHGGPHEWVPSPLEVAEVLEVPVSHLLDPANLAREQRERDGERVEALAYLFEGHRIWGATARMLTEYLDLLREAAIRPAHEGRRV
jgi:8-oxo-dGTP pyrophosphatase MutT (NUDIX family)